MFRIGEIEFRGWLKYQMITKKNMLLKYHIPLELWERKFLQLYYNNDHRTRTLIKEFLNCDIEKISSNKVKRNHKNAPLLFCVIKNDIEKITLFMEHYRNLGIETFVFLDNNSTDGTREFLLQQKDAIVWECKQEYSSERRVAWLNKLLAIYGENKWCLIVDSDEFIRYVGCENYSMRDIVKMAKHKGVSRVEGFMLDMYSDRNLFEQSSGENVILDNCYFDKDTYRLISNNEGLIIQGGPRKRIFNTNLRLSKYPLFYFGSEEMVASSHFMYPVKKSPLWFAICHYKFIDDKDMKKIEEAVIKGNYASGSADYKAYLKRIKSEEDLMFYSEKHSVKLKDSSSLDSISFLKNPFV